MSPTEHQRCFSERTPARPRKGLDVWAHGLVGRWRRGPSQRRRLAKLARDISLLREELEQLADPALNERLHAAQRDRRAHPRLRASCCEGLALLAVAAHRETGLRAYEVQLMSAAALVEGFFTEVDTGEGKTLAIGLAAAFQAWDGTPCHVITANDYLAERDAKQLRRFYERVGLTTGAVLSEHDDNARRESYASSVTYTTAKEVAADYLRDRLRMEVGGSAAGKSSARLIGLVIERPLQAAPVQRGLHCALIDEADHALIDEAVTPLIISRNLDAAEITAAAHAAWELARELEPVKHYRPDPETRMIEIVAAGIIRVKEELNLPRTGLWASERRRLELVGLGLEAREFFLRDKQYVIDEGKVVIVDPATGRPMPMRTWRQGLHQIIEAKEGLDVTGPSETLARISFQAFFRKYERLAGASGSLSEAASEIWHTYAVPFVTIPRHLPCQRQFAGTRFFATGVKRDAALLHEVKTRHARGQPMLIGTHTVESSEAVANLLHANGLPGGQVLNARRHREEAVLVGLAGQEGQIMIATGMAGRGTDIRLGNGVAALGGLHVVATEVNESARVDRQLYGRAARQGDPGSVIAFYSADDAVLARFLPKFVLRLWTRSFSIPWLAQWSGRVLLAWTQWAARRQAMGRRRNIMIGEEEIRRSLGFTMGRSGALRQ